MDFELQAIIRLGVGLASFDTNDQMEFCKSLIKAF
jgi:hypothetical protein